MNKNREKKIKKVFRKILLDSSNRNSDALQLINNEIFSVEIQVSYFNKQNVSKVANLIFLKKYLLFYNQRRYGNS